MIGATLGDDDGDDNRSWLKKTKKQEKALAVKRQAEIDRLHEIDPDAYTESEWRALSVCVHLHSH